jgi:hypothetical protein
MPDEAEHVEMAQRVPASSGRLAAIEKATAGPLRPQSFRLEKTPRPGAEMDLIRKEQRRPSGRAMSGPPAIAPSRQGLRQGCELTRYG